MNKRQGTLVWEGAHIDWQYATFKDDKTFELHPHFTLTATDPKTNESVTWPSVELSSDDSSIKGITDFTKLPKQLMGAILDNAVAKLNETEPEITRITPNGLEAL